MIPRIRNLIIIAAVLAAVVAVVVYEGRRTQSAIAVSIVKTTRAAFITKLPENGVVQRPRVATVPTLVAGNLGTIAVHSGEYVTAGQLLATVTNPQLESNAASSQADYDSATANVQTAKINEQNARVGYVAAVQTAKSNLDEAQRVYRADVSLYANKAIPRNQLDTDRAKLDQMRVQYEQAAAQLKLGAVTGYGQNSVQYADAAAQKAQIVNAQNQQQLGFERITAPFSGTVQTVATQPNDPLTPLHAGDPVVQGQALFTIAEHGRYIVKAQVDEQDIINVHVGQQADISGEDFPGRIVGHVTAISPVAIKSSDASSTARQILTTIRLDRSPSFLRDGMTVNVDILTAYLPGAILVPTTAIGKTGNRSFVYVVRRGKASKVFVTTGASNDTQTVIRSGLAGGEHIVAEQDIALHDGVRVSPLPSPSAAPAV